MNFVSVFLSVCISTVGSVLAISNFSGKKLNLKNFLIYFIIMTPLFVIINLYFTGVVKITSVLIATIISLYFSLFNKRINDSVYYAIVYEIFAFISEVILSIIFVTLFNFNNDSYNTIPFSIIIFTFFTSLFIYLISKIKVLDKRIMRFNGILAKKQYEKFYITVVIILATMLLAFNGANLKKDLSFYINIGMIFFVLVTLIYIIYRDFQNAKLENNYNEMMDYVCKYEKIINDQGKKNHEYNNQLMVIKGYVKNPKKLEEYLKLIIDEHKCGQNYTIRELSYFPDGGIKGLIYHKLSKMDDNEIKYFLYIDKNTKNIFEDKFELKTYQDITKLLGVFLDNAIEATLDAKEKEIELEVKNDEDSSIITISNTYNINQDISKIGKKDLQQKVLVMDMVFR